MFFNLYALRALSYNEDWLLMMNTNNKQPSHRVGQRGIDGFVATRHSGPSYVRGRAVVPQLAPPVVASAENMAEKHQSVSEGQNVANLESIPHFDFPRYKPHKKPVSIVQKRLRWGKLLAKTSTVLGIFVVLTGGFIAWRGYANIHKVFQGSGTVAALSSQKVAPELLKGEGDGRVNILLLGIGGQNHPGGDLADSIVVLSVDPVNGTAAMLSVPRDMWVKMSVNYFGAYQKINAAYSSAKFKYLGKVDLASTNQQAIEAGFSAIDSSIGDVLGINISYHVLVNFQAFQQAVDSVNGVTVNVASQLYDPTMAWENGNNPVLAATGLQTMHGKQALNFARSRETSSDFARSERQRQLLVSLKEKVLTVGTLSSPAKITNLMNSFGNNVHTDLSTQAANRLFSIMKGINDADIASLSLTTPVSLVTTDRVGNISVVRPKAGFNTYSDIQTYVRSQLKDGYLLKEKASVQVVAATESLAAQTADTLKSYGYSVTGSSVAAGLPAGVTIVNKSAGKAPYTLHYLQDRYGFAAVTELPKGIVVPNGTQFVIIVGT